jgi:hypothetical protein
MFWQEERMLIQKPYACGVVTIVVRKHVEERLANRCFRGRHIRRAGNFFEYSSANGLFAVKHIFDEFVKEVVKRWEAQELDTRAVTIESASDVGWESTTPLSNFKDDDLELFELNRRATGLRVKLGRTDIRAPKTRDVTIVFAIKNENNYPTAVIFSIYPGVDVGELEDDVTEREGRAFFDWNHPGE